MGSKISADLDFQGASKALNLLLDDINTVSVNNQLGISGDLLQFQTSGVLKTVVTQNTLILEDKLSFHPSINTSAITSFKGSTAYIDTVEFDLDECDSVSYETRLAGNTTWTSRADIAAIRTFAGTVGTDIWYLKVSTVPDAAWTIEYHVIIRYISNYTV